MSRYGFSYGSDKYKEPDDFNALFIMHITWKEATDAMAKLNTASVSRKFSYYQVASEKFDSLYSMTFTALEDKGCDLEKEGFAELDIPEHHDNWKWLKTKFRQYQKLLFKFHVLTYEKKRHTKEGGGFIDTDEEPQG